jgi:hypothetical protein
MTQPVLVAPKGAPLRWSSDSEEHSQHQSAINDALENKKRADLVMAVYHGHTKIDIVMEEADLIAQSVSTVLRLEREKGLKPNKFMQVTRFVNHFF